MQVKAKQVDKFLEKRLQVRLNLEVRGRMGTKPELLEKVIKDFIALLQNAGSSSTLSNKGKTISCLVYPKKVKNNENSTKQENP